MPPSTRLMKKEKKEKTSKLAPIAVGVEFGAYLHTGVGPQANFRFRLDSK